MATKKQVDGWIKKIEKQKFAIGTERDMLKIATTEMPTKGPFKQGGTTMDETLKGLLIVSVAFAAFVWLVAIATNILGITGYPWPLLLLPAIAVWGVKIALLVLAPLGLLMEKMRQRLNRKLQKTETDE